MSKYQAKYANIATSTDAIVTRGSYVVGGHVITVRDNVSRGYKNSKMYFNDQNNYMNSFQAVLSSTPPASEMTIDFVNKSVISACDELSFDYSSIAVLNFASATRPGGGYMRGANAQEESIARVSSLVTSLNKFSEEFYMEHSRTGDLYYSNRIIYSPEVVVIKGDDGVLLEEPYCINVITSPAVNRAELERRGGCNSKKVYAVMRERIRQIIAVAAMNNNEALVLGAFGCGVFGNNPKDIAGIFAQVLVKEGYMKFFKRIVFAVYDKENDSTVRAFKNDFDAVALKK